MEAGTSNYNILDNAVDKSQIPPIHQKRILTFVNHFVINTCTFLNEFAVNCENKFIDLERQLERMEAALTILEAKLASISDLDDKPIPNQEPKEPKHPPTVEKTEPDVTNTDVPSNIESISIEQTVETPKISGVKACEDQRYRKFFKMLQFGVPLQAVKNKLQLEGYEPSILDSPNKILEDGIPYEPVD